MLQLFFKKKKILKITEDQILIAQLKLPFVVFQIVINGRIFKWLKKPSFFKFLLPVANRPFIFFNKTIFFVRQKETNLLFFIEFSNQKTFILTHLLRVRKPSIFSKRGYHVFKRILFKKKGKITTYITNKH